MSEAPNPTPEAPAQGAPAAPSTTAELLYPSDSATAAPSSVSEGEGEQSAPPAPPVAEGAPPSEGADSETTVAEGAESTAAPEYDFKFPENFEVDDALITDAKKTMADAGVPADKAQPLVDLFVKVQEAAAAKQMEAFTATQKAWAEEINAMPEFQGPTRETSLQTIGRLVDEHPGLRDVLKDPAVGNNPIMAKFMLSVAKALSEGSPAPASRPAPNGADGRPARGRTPGQILYPETQQ